MTRSVTMVSFSGVDGAGKTTLLRAFLAILKEEGRPYVELRHRPSILPILSSARYGKASAEQRTQTQLPRLGQNRSTWSSSVRFAYYFLDYLLGQWVIYFRYTRKGVVVVYDRYYFDFIVDSRRSNIDLNSAVMRLFYRFVFKPQLNILLYADADAILARKSELSKSDINTLTENYLEIFEYLQERYKGDYLAIENKNPESTLDVITDAYKRLSAC